MPCGSCSALHGVNPNQKKKKKKKKKNQTNKQTKNASTVRSKYLSNRHAMFKCLISIKTLITGKQARAARAKFHRILLYLVSLQCRTTN